MLTDDEHEILTTHQILFSCEGSAERVITETLLAADALIVDSQQAIRGFIDERPTTACRSAESIQKQFLRYDYDQPIAIVRILDSPKEQFKLAYPYNEQIPVLSFYTRPEIEILAIIKEGKWSQYTNQSKIKPSIYCKTVLQLPSIKQESFLRDYWSDTDELCTCIRQYNQYHNSDNSEHTLYDLLR